MKIIMRGFVYLVWLVVMGFGISLTHQLSSKVIGLLTIIGGIFYLRAAMNWQDKRAKDGKF